jgi:hypothetical protein
MWRLQLNSLMRFSARQKQRKKVVWCGVVRRKMGVA